jgi:hypothetical protein
MYQTEAAPKIRCSIALVYIVLRYYRFIAAKLYGRNLRNFGDKSNNNCGNNQIALIGSLRC